MKTIRIYYSLALIIMFVSCSKTNDKPKLNLDNIVKIEIYNRSYKVDQDNWNKNHKRRLEIVDLDTIKNLVDVLKQTEFISEEMTIGGNYGAIEVTLFNNKGEKFYYRNIYSKYHGVYVSYEEKYTFIKDYKNNNFVSLIEHLLYTGITTDEAIDKLNEALNKQ